MTKQELKAKIDKLENGIKSKATPSNLIAPLKAQKAKLEKELQDMEAAEKKAVKTKKVSKVAEKIKAAKKSVAKKTPAKAPAKEERKKDNIVRDGDRKSLPAGKRISKTGKVYYENRVNRSDKQTSRKPYLAKGGNLKFYDKENSYRLARPSGYIEKDILRKVTFNEDDFVGNFGWKTSEGKLADGYLFKLNEYDQNLVKDIKLKEGEKIYRYFNRTSAIGGMKPLIKISTDKELLYFLAESENDEIVFETKGVQAQWIALIQDKMADGGELTEKKLLVLKADDEKGGNVFVSEEVVKVKDLDDAKSKVKEFVSKYNLDDKTFTGGRYFKLVKTSKKTGNVTSSDVKSEELGTIDYKGNFKSSGSKMANGGETDWGADLGGGFSIGNDVYITDSKSLFQGKTGFVSGSVGRDLLVTIMDNGNERSVVVSKKGVEKLDAPEYTDGGNIKYENELKNKNMNYAEGGELNLAVRKMASQKGLTPKKLGADYELTMAQAAVDALTDANYHDAARKLVSILENKPEIAEKPDYPSVSDPDFKVKMGAINEKYDSKYWHGDEKTRDFAVKVSQSSGWDGNGIAGAFEYLLRMEGYHRLADKIKKSVELSDADKIADFAYTNDIYATGNSFEDFSRRVKEKSGINYSEEDLQIAYNLLSNARYSKGGYMAYGGKTKSRKSMKDLTIEQISSMTGVGKAGIERFSDENKLSEEDLSNIMQGLGRRMISASDFVTAVSGNKDNQYTKEIVDFAKSGKGYKMADGGMIYNMADNMTDAEYEKKLSSLNEKQKKTYESLVRLGDSPKLALATTLLSNEVKWSDDTTRAYTMAKGGKVPAHFGSGRNIDVFGYQTENFDICGTAVKEFEAAMETMQNDKISQEENLSKTAEYVDKIFAIEKEVVKNGSSSSAEFQHSIIDSMTASIYNYRANLIVNLYKFVPMHIQEIAVRMAKAEKGGFYALGGMTAGRWYRDKSGEEFKFIGKIDSGENKGKFLFTDGQKSVYKDLEDFEGGKPKETKLFGFFEDGGMMAKGGALQHGLKIGDTIRDFAENSVAIYNVNDKKSYLVDLDKGERNVWLGSFQKRIKYSEEGGIMADGGKIDYSKQTSDDFKLGEIVWDVDNERYGTIIGIYDGYLSDKYEVRLDTDGMQPTENLRKVGSEGDNGTKEQLKEEIDGYARLVKSYPENNYPKQIEPMLEKGGYMAKGGEIAFDNSNLYLNGFGMDSNGNSVVKVSFPNQRAFSIQTNGVLKETNNLYTKNIKELTEAQIKTIEKEVVDYVKQFGSKEQKQRLKTYSGYMAKGGVMPKGARSGMKIKDWYIKNYPTDDLGKEINDTMTFRGFWALTGQGNNPYEVLGVHDSVVRERVEEKLSQILGKKQMADGGVTDSFEKKVKDAMKEPNKWHFISEEVDGKDVQLKMFVGTKEVDVQIFKINGIHARMPRNYSGKRDTLKMIMDNFESKMAKGGIYSSDSLYILKVSKDGKEVGEERFQAKNVKEAREMGEDYEDEYKSKFGGDLSFSVKQAEPKMASGGKVKVGDVYKRKGFGKLKITKIDEGKFRKVYFKYDDNDKEFFEGMYGAEGKVANKEWVKVDDKMADGGKVKFADKVKSVQESLLKRKKVSPKVQKDYGKTYSKAEAKESAQRIVGSRMAQLKEKMAKKKK
jgi:hypothetical protein